jgi:hypothetical protein
MTEKSGSIFGLFVILPTRRECLLALAFESDALPSRKAALGTPFAKVQRSIHHQSAPEFCVQYLRLRQVYPFGMLKNIVNSSIQSYSMTPKALGWEYISMGSIKATKYSWKFIRKDFASVFGFAFPEQL